MSMVPLVEPPLLPATQGMTAWIGRVRQRRRDGPQVWTLEIAPEEGPAPPFVPGQFNMLTAFGIGEAPISFSGDPANTSRLVHTVRAVGPVSAALARLAPGEIIGVRGPFGAGWPIAEAEGHDVVIIAGGLGLAPLRPVLYSLFTRRERYGRLVLLYGTRSPEEILFRRVLDMWRDGKDLEIEGTVDHAPAGWHGHVGVVTGLISRAGFDPKRSIALVCGPEVMMRFAIAALGQAGVAKEFIYLSMERNMKCAIGHCGHCQFGPVFVCRDGPVFRSDRVRDLLTIKEL